MRQIRTSAEHHLKGAIRLRVGVGAGEGRGGVGVVGVVGGGQVGTQQLSLRVCLYPHGRSMT